MSISIQIINKSNNELPQYATLGSSGMDVRAFIEQQIELQPLERYAVPTGLYIAIPQGYEIQVRPRSGLALKNGITCLNTPGTIDSDYRGEIKVILINLSNQSQIIVNGDRIAQLVLQKTESIIWEATQELNSTQRNEGGFGHSGIK
jgi:dUTP pyrophosphatase